MDTLLEIVPEYVLSWMVKRGNERHLQEHEILLKEGTHNSSLYIVLDGLLSTVAPSQGERRVAHRPPGSIVGELSQLADDVATETVMAEEPSLVLEISKQTLQEKLDHDHVFAADFYRVLLIYTSKLLRDATVRLHAAERAAAGVNLNPLLDKAQGEIEKFKKLMVDLDKDALKHGSISEERYQQFHGQASTLMYVCHELLGTSSSLEDVHKQQISIRLQNEMLPYVLTTETAERFYSKPRGYAGDYLAIHKIYQNQPVGTGRLGPIVDRMFLETPPSIAVRNRRKLLANEIVSSVNAKSMGTLNVLCMASGPATEVFDAFSTLKDKSRLKVTLMDIDLQALAFVDELLGKHKIAAQVTLVNENLIALFLGRGKTKIEPQDIIYSTGLIDYLNDKLVGKLLRYVYENLSAGGRVILGNFHPKNPAKEFMDSVLEWNLIHRTEEDMNVLFKNSPFGRPCTRIQFEDQGIDLFAECVKE
jgi:extracellular factor (EF) 3-hydroxypalmitic acid methyl ester biosynthesis protein